MIVFVREEKNLLYKVHTIIFIICFHMMCSHKYILLSMAAYLKILLSIDL